MPSAPFSQIWRMFPMLLPSACGMFAQLAFWIHTIFLFTQSDLKTTFFPIIASAVAAAPVAGGGQLFHAAAWLWIHILWFNLSNQSRSIDEDKINKPWRPLPSGRITVDTSRKLYWIFIAICHGLSAWHGTGAFFASIAFFVAIFLYDDCNYSSDGLMKNLLNAWGYLSLEFGTTIILASVTPLDRTSFVALLISGLLIFTTIHAQDFADVDGDRRTGRRTLPMIAPQGSRICTLAALPLWSITLAAFWGLGPVCGTLFLSMGTFVGIRYFWFRDVKHDRSSYVMYNVWLLAANALPLNARSSDLQGLALGGLIN